MRFCWMPLFLGLALLIAGVPARGADETLYVGMAEADITPPEGFPVAGYYHERLATGVHDPLKAKALLFRDGTEAAVLVVCDLTGISTDLTLEVRRRASEKTGIPAGRVFLSATHSHTAPDYTRHLYQYLVREETKPEKRVYADTLIDGVVEAIVKANAAAAPAVVEAGGAMQETPVSFNRRFVMKDGTVKTWQRLDTPGVIRAAGPIDPEIGLLMVRTAQGGKPLGLLSNFALHLDTVGGTLWSGDYPYYIEQSLRKSEGADFISIFGNGCCGDINHVDPVKKERNKTDFIGQSLAATIEAGLPKLTPVHSPRLRVCSQIVELPLRDISAAEIERARIVLTAEKGGTKQEFFDLVTAYRNLLLDHLHNKPSTVPTADYIGWGLSHRLAGVGDKLPVEVHVISLRGAVPAAGKDQKEQDLPAGANDVAIVFLPGEVFVDLGLAIKRASPFKTTLIIELSNAKETAYIPTRAAIAGGSYEVTNSTLKPGAGELLVETALQLLGEAAREP